MQNTVNQYLSQIGEPKGREALQFLMQYVAGNVNTQALTSAGLVIKAVGGVLSKTGVAATYLLANGRLVSIAAGTDMPALTGLTITASRFNVACFFINSSGTVSVRFGTEGTAIGRITWPDFPFDQALVGILLITHSSAFTGGTTALDAATTVYLSPVGAVDPTFLFT